MKTADANLTLLLLTVRECSRKRKRMFKFFALIGFLFCTGNVFSQSSIYGTVTDRDTGEPVLFGDVILYKGEVLISGEQTDFDGNYSFSSLDAGIYNIYFKYIGASDVKVENIVLVEENSINVNGELDFTVYDFGCHGVSYQVPLIQIDDFGSGQTFTSEQIRRMPIRN